MKIQEDPSSNQRLPILVVGASGVIGMAAADLLSRARYSIGLHYCANISVIDQFLQEHKSNVHNLVPMQSGLRTIEDGEALVANFVKKFNGIYGLVICSGNVSMKDWMELDKEDWNSVFFQHCILPFALAKYSVKHMIHGGRIIYLSSISPKYSGSTTTLHYAAAKGALEISMKGLARELAQSKILINGVRSGFIHSPQHKNRTDEQISDRLKKVPLKRAGRAVEVASAIEYLLSQNASYITGELITVAGGD